MKNQWTVKINARIYYFGSDLKAHKEAYRFARFWSGNLTYQA